MCRCTVQIFPRNGITTVKWRLKEFVEIESEVIDVWLVGLCVGVK